MDVDSIRRYCLSFSEATENLQWGEDLCFKVRGKIFATVALGAVPQCMCFKCTAEGFVELLEREGIVPAPYVGRYKWVLLEHLDALPERELEERIRQSYEMVVAKAPKTKTKKVAKSKRQPRKAKKRTAKLKK